MKPISFYINKQEEKGNHIALSGWYFLCAAKNLALSLVDLLHLIVKTIKRYPIHAITATVIIAVIVCFVKVGQARITSMSFISQSRSCNSMKSQVGT